ncbi:MAG TPA: hypothetical protein VJR87_09250 [Allosphingosinicella sp.]|nr:hypothetical protein [Allosphingosinicella sp.]
MSGGEAKGIDDRPRHAAIVMLSAVVAAALAQRIYFLAATDFPINDGGLFYAFVKEVAATFPGLPDSVRFNAIDIPFAYPPLSFWMAALLTRLGFDALAIVHVAPILMNMAYVLLFALVLHRSGRSLLFVAITLFFLCTMIRAFEWLVMGGGLSRGLGSLFLMATLLATGIPDRSRAALPYWRLVAAGIAVAGAILSHFEWGLNAAGCVILVCALGSPSLKDFVRSNLIAGVTALLLVAPWLLSIYAAHGLTPFLSAGGSSSWGLGYTLVHLVTLWGQSLANPLILLGLAIALRRRDYFWPLFLLLCILVTPRHAETPLTMPMAVFCAHAVNWLYAWLCSRMREMLAGATVAAIALILVVPHLDRNFLAHGNRVRSLSPSVLQAMNWVARTHPGESFIVLTRSIWYYNSSAEWFPVLANARSTNTLQGREWIPGAYWSFYGKDVALKRVRSCAEMFDRLKAYERPRYYWTEAKQECFEAAGYRAIYRNPPVVIFQPPEPTLAASPRPEARENGADRSRHDQHVHPE